MSKLIRSWSKVLEKDLEQVVDYLKLNLPTPAVVILAGEMGAGKTTFMRYFNREENLDQENFMMSPTYSIVNQYNHIVHADLYRIEEAEELLELDLDSYFFEDDQIFFIEWGDKFYSQLKEIFNQQFYKIEVEILNSTSRKIDFIELD